MVLRVQVTLECTECKSRNYMTTRKREQAQKKLELRKFCRKCHKHTLHKESR